MRRLSDMIMMVAVGLMAVGLLLSGVGASARLSGPDAPEHLWIYTAFAGFMLGLCWRFLFWDLPAILWDIFMINRRNLQYVVVLGAGIAVLMLI